MCNALLAARSPPPLSRCLTVLPDDAGTGLTPHSDVEAGFRSARKSFRIVAGRKEKLGSASMADRMAGDEVRGQFVDDGGDHRVEICDLVMQLEVTAAEGLGRPILIGGIQVAIGGKIGSPSTRPAYGRAACG